MLEIRELLKEDIYRIYDLDGKFNIDSYLNISLKDNKFMYNIVQCESREKEYNDEDDEIAFEEFIEATDKIVFLAFCKSEYVGRIILRKEWNNYIHIDDITVDREYRSHGIGHALMDRAKEWAIRRGVKGLSLETQNNNVSACKFYERYGFILGGVNMKLYTAFNNDEIALFWYYLFEYYNSAKTLE